jgi:hypothetical protein
LVSIVAGHGVVDALAPVVHVTGVVRAELAIVAVGRGPTDAISSVALVGGRAWLAIITIAHGVGVTASRGRNTAVDGARLSVVAAEIRVTRDTGAVRAGVAEGTGVVVAAIGRVVRGSASRSRIATIVCACVSVIAAFGGAWLACSAFALRGRRAFIGVVTARGVVGVDATFAGVA